MGQIGICNHPCPFDRWAHCDSISWRWGCTWLIIIIIQVRSLGVSNSSPDDDWFTRCWRCKGVETPRWPVTWACLLVDSTIAICLLIYYLLVLSLTQSLMIPLPHHTNITNLLQDHTSVHKHRIWHEHDYVAQTPLIHTASLAVMMNSSYWATPPRWVVTSSFPLCPIPFHLHPFPLFLLGLLRIIPHSL